MPSHTLASRLSAGKSVIFALFCALALSAVADPDDHSARINMLLDDFHLAAAEADRDRYLGYFAPDGVFMGTDDWERWPLPVFIEYVEGRFSNGGGWNYVSEDRVIAFDPSGKVAWFDEIMVSQRWGRFRGTGVLLLDEGNWKIAHYSLTVLVPNESFEAVSDVASKGFADRSQEKEQDSDD